MAGAYHSDTDSSSDGSGGIAQRSIAPFLPARRLVATAYYSPRKLRSRKQPPHTPARKHSYSTPNAPERPEFAGESAGPSTERLYIPTLQESTRGNLDPWTAKGVRVHAAKVLHRQLNALPAIITTTVPAINRAAQEQGIHKRELEVVPWHELRSYDDPKEFLEILFGHYDVNEPLALGPTKQHARGRAGAPGSVDALTKQIGRIGLGEDSVEKGLDMGEGLMVDYFPQIERFLTNEANASEAFISNALNGVAATVQEFLPEDYRPEPYHYEQSVGPGLKIICSGQHTLPGQTDSSGRASALDLTFALVSWPPSAEPKLRFDLVICELKRPGYVLHEHWKAPHFEAGRPVQSGHVRQLLPQLMLYNHRSGCERFILSDYLCTVAVHVEHASMIDEAKGPVVVGARPIGYQPGKPKSPYDGGVGTAIAYEIAQALKALGCVKTNLFRNAYLDSEGHAHPVALHKEIKDFLDKRPVERAEHSPGPRRR